MCVDSITVILLTGEAFEILSDENLRSEYDRELSLGRRYRNY